MKLKAEKDVKFVDSGSGNFLIKLSGNDVTYTER